MEEAAFLSSSLTDITWKIIKLQIAAGNAQPAPKDLAAREGALVMVRLDSVCGLVMLGFLFITSCRFVFDQNSLSSFLFRILPAQIFKSIFAPGNSGTA